ncbi:helix-turn-helix domain-containing protein [Halalkalicoccus salilacus]|uniref:helix-turn-helix domain-containing protein n=1 Tax=unclassified Halalkalicoccus TaxID=2621952 RepID=UPI002F96E629
MGFWVRIPVPASLRFQSRGWAKRLGYYDVPRTVTLTELANKLDISHQALSERLRRAHANLIDRTISSTEGRSDRPRPDLLT